MRTNAFIGGGAVPVEKRGSTFNGSSAACPTQLIAANQGMTCMLCLRLPVCCIFMPRKNIERLQGVIHISDWYATLCTLAGADYVDHAAEEANKILRAQQLPLLAPVVSRRNMYRVGNLDMGHCLRCTFDMSIDCFQQSLILHLFNLKS